MNKRKLKSAPGDIVRVQFSDDMYSYARVLKSPLFAFYDRAYRVEYFGEDVYNESIAFKIWVSSYAVSSGRWKVVGKLPLSRELEETPRFFKRDMLSKKYYIYFDGKETPASRNDCVGLERAAVWDPEQVEERLRGQFLGIESKNLAVMRLPDE